MKWLFCLLIVIYTPNENTNQIKVYNLKENSRFEIEETLSDGYGEKVEEQKQDSVSYDEINYVLQKHFPFSF